MSHGRNSRSLDHAEIAKTGFLAGLGLFVVGAVGELAGHSAASSMSETNSPRPARKPVLAIFAWSRLREFCPWLMSVVPDY